MQINKVSNINFKGQIISRPNKTSLKEALSEAGDYSKTQINVIAQSTDKFCKRLEKETPDGVLCSVSIEPSKHNYNGGEVSGIKVEISGAHKKYKTGKVAVESFVETSEKNKSGKKTCISVFGLNKDIKEAFKYGIKLIKNYDFEKPAGSPYAQVDYI